MQNYPKIHNSSLKPKTRGAESGNAAFELCNFSERSCSLSWFCLYISWQLQPAAFFWEKEREKSFDAGPTVSSGYLFSLDRGVFLNVSSKCQLCDDNYNIFQNIHWYSPSESQIQMHIQILSLREQQKRYPEIPAISNIPPGTLKHC